jgi:hypothetical protein
MNTVRYLGICLYDGSTVPAWMIDQQYSVRLRVRRCRCREVLFHANEYSTASHAPYSLCMHFRLAPPPPSSPPTNSSSHSLIPQSQQETAATAPSSTTTTSRQIRNIRISRQQLRNILLRLNPPNQHQPITALRHSPANRIRGLGLALRANDIRLPLLLGLFNDEARALGLLLGDLLLLDGLGELLAERHVRDGHVLEGDVELAGALEQVGADAVGHGFALGDELGGVELGDDGFEDFVADGGEDTLVVIHAEVLQSLISTLFYLTTNVALYVVLPLRVCMGYVPGKS